MKRATYITILSVILAIIVPVVATGQRRMTPVNNPATATQPINETKNDTARINEQRRSSMAHYHDENGNIIYIDTITGREWRDSTEINRRKRMEYPLFHEAAIGLNLWDPIMRMFGQKYGLAEIWGELSLHNRYKPIFELGLGQADYTPSDGNYSYRSPVSLYFKLGMNYNFIYNSSPDYQFFAGLRYGFSPFSYKIVNITVDSPYWDESSRFDIPSQHSTVGWWELVLGLKVKIWGPISAGWTFRYHSMIHESKNVYGAPWYIPGFGTRKSAISGSFSVSYTLPLRKKSVAETGAAGGTDDMSKDRLIDNPATE